MILTLIQNINKLEKVRNYRKGRHPEAGLMAGHMGQTSRIQDSIMQISIKGKSVGMFTEQATTNILNFYIKKLYINGKINQVIYKKCFIGYNRL